LDDLDAIAVGIMHEEAVRTRNWGRFLNLQTLVVALDPRGAGIRDPQSEVPGTRRVGPVLQQKMELRITELKPDHDKVKGPRLVDFAKAQDISVEAAAAFNIGNEDRSMIELLDFYVLAQQEGS
jgi:hypothetical protein